VELDSGHGPIPTRCLVMISEAGERPTAITTKHKTGGDGEEVGQSRPHIS
jgi:hypothetical protein